MISRRVRTIAYHMMLTLTMTMLATRPASSQTCQPSYFGSCVNGCDVVFLDTVCTFAFNCYDWGQYCVINRFAIYDIYLETGECNFRCATYYDAACQYSC